MLITRYKLEKIIKVVRWYDRRQEKTKRDEGKQVYIFKKKKKKNIKGTVAGD